MHKKKSLRSRILFYVFPYTVTIIDADGRINTYQIRVILPSTPPSMPTPCPVCPGLEPAQQIPRIHCGVSNNKDKEQFYVRADGNTETVKIHDFPPVHTLFRSSVGVKSLETVPENSKLLPTETCRFRKKSLAEMMYRPRLKRHRNY